MEKQQARRLAEAFFTATRSGDVKALGDMLAADVSSHADGGGKRPAAMHPMLGFEAVMKQYGHHREGAAEQSLGRLCASGFVNGLPGFVTREGDGELQTTALDIADGKIVAIYVMRNPDKPRRLY